MTGEKKADIIGDAQRRFDVQLFIVHPTLDPDEISRILGLEAHFSHRVGDRRRTPKQLLSGTYRDTRWRHCIRYTVTEQHFATEVIGFVERLDAHKEFLAKVTSTGGTASIIVCFLGDGYFGDELPPATLAKLADLGLALAVECFMVPQS
jgi:hypothetical protein